MALDYSVIGERLQKIRVKKEMTQEALAEKINVSVAYISRIECGTARINLSRLSQLCSILDVDEGLILNGTNIESDNYLSNEFSELLNNCSKEKQKLIYNIAKLISEQK